MLQKFSESNVGANFNLAYAESIGYGLFEGVKLRGSWQSAVVVGNNTFTEIH